MYYRYRTPWIRLTLAILVTVVVTLGAERLWLDHQAKLHRLPHEYREMQSLQLPRIEEPYHQTVPYMQANGIPLFISIRKQNLPVGGSIIDARVSDCNGLSVEIGENEIATMLAQLRENGGYQGSLALTDLCPQQYRSGPRYVSFQ